MLSMSSCDRNDRVGMAFLVGSGIGGLDYLTFRGMELLQTADAVVYDALADEGLLSVCKSTCERYNVGKRGGSKDSSALQSEINDLLVKLTSVQGKQVVRLKAGDPFVFGRSKGEIHALQAARVPFEVVPGVTSAIAGPLMAGIAVTDPDVSRSFAVLSGFDKDSMMPEKLSGLLSVDTLVFLMSASRLEDLASRLIGAGFSPSTPVAVIRWAGHADKQQIWSADLETIVAVTTGESLSPAVIVVGKTAGQPICGPVERLSHGRESAIREKIAFAPYEGDQVLADRYETFLLDMDGVLWEGGHALPGAVEAVSELKRRGRRVLFVTNNSARTRAEVAAKLNGLAPFNATPGDVITSGWAAAKYLLSRGVTRCFMVGGEGLKRELEDAGVACVQLEREMRSEADFVDFLPDPAVGAVVSGVDFTFSWSKIAAASAYIQGGCMLIGTNPDTANSAGGRLMPENGAQLAALEAASGVSATVVGKPSKILVDLMESIYGCDPSTTIMIGDRIDTDITFGNVAGIATALVLTGVTTAAHIDSEVQKGTLTGDRCPKYIMDNLASAISGNGMR